MGTQEKNGSTQTSKACKFKAWLSTHKLSTKAPSSSNAQIVMRHRHGYRLKRLNIAVGTSRMISMIKAQNHGV